jgi:hypothetical protein
LHEISTTEAGEEIHTVNGVGILLRESIGPGVKSLSQLFTSVVWPGASEGLRWWSSVMNHLGSTFLHNTSVQIQMLLSGRGLS